MLGSGICEKRHHRAVVRDERGATTSNTCIERGLSRERTRERHLGVVLEVMKDDRRLRTPADRRVTGPEEYPRRMVDVSLEIMQEAGEIDGSFRVLEAGNDVVIRVIHVEERDDTGWILEHAAGRHGAARGIDPCLEGERVIDVIVAASLTQTLVHEDLRRRDGTHERDFGKRSTVRLVETLCPQGW